MDIVAGGTIKQGEANQVNLAFTYRQGGQLPQAQLLTLDCIDLDTGASHPITATVADTAPWLTLEPVSGNTPFAMLVTVNPAGMPVGLYTAVVSVPSTSQPVTNANISITVSLNVLPALADVDIDLRPGGQIKTVRITRRKTDRETDMQITVNKSTVVYVNGVKQ